MPDGTPHRAAKMNPGPANTCVGFNNLVSGVRRPAFQDPAVGLAAASGLHVSTPSAVAGCFRLDELFEVREVLIDGVVVHTEDGPDLL